MRRIIALVFLLLVSAAGFAQEIERVEPPCWWVGMKTDLQLLIKGDNIRGSTLILAPEDAKRGVSVGKIYNGDSPNYIFADIKIGGKAPAVGYNFILVTPDQDSIRFEYTLYSREKGSAQRTSFGPQDVIYLLMPDRFANGDYSNDSVEEAIEKCDRSLPEGRHGGDIQGIINHLDYITELGVTAIWSTPMLFDNEKEYSYHGYACADYYRIDPRYGTNDLYREFVEAAAKKDIKVIMDMVPNHCGLAHWWMEDLPFDDWVHMYTTFTPSSFALSIHYDPYVSKYDKDACIKGWFDTTMPDINLANPFVHQYFTQMAVWWVEFAGLGGIRVDTFPYSDQAAMAKWVKNILREYPKMNIVGECWYGDPLSCSYWEGTKQHDGYNSNLPSIMDFPLRDAIIAGFADDSDTPFWGEGIIKVYNSLSLDFIYNDPSNILIFANNHDTNRLAHDLKGDFAKQKMVMALLATMRGVPQLYYGDELGFMSKDGTTGHSQERIDFPGGWKGDRINLFERSGRTPAQKDLFDYTSRLLNWRKGSKAVTQGSLLHYRPERDNVYVYFRYVRKEVVMVVINNGKSDFKVDWGKYQEISSKFAASVRNVITGETFLSNSYVMVPGQSAAIFEFK
jgi:glycosidase